MHRAEGTVRCHHAVRGADPAPPLAQLRRGVEEHREHPGRHRQHVRRPGGPAGRHAGVRGARAPRTSGLTWAQGHNDPRPTPSPPPFLRPLCTAVPSRTSRPSGFAQRRRYLRIVLTDSAPALAGLPFAEAKKPQNITKKPTEETKQHALDRNGPLRCRGSRGGCLSTYLSGGHRRHTCALPAPAPWVAAARM